MKLYLTINGGTLTGKTFDLETGFLTIGRGENCSIKFDPNTERIASKQHAFIEAKQDGYYLTDNQSTNGTILNGERVQTAKINSGDKIQFGKNGVEAQVRIEGETDFNRISQSLHPQNNSQADFQSQKSFQDYQLQQFNQTAQYEPVSVQNSLSHLGLGHIESTTQPNNTGKYVGIGITIFAVIFFSFIVSLLMFASVGIGTAIMASFVAFIPAVFYLVPLIWLDRYDPEPVVA